MLTGMANCRGGADDGTRLSLEQEQKENIKRIIHCMAWDLTMGAHGLNSQEEYQMSYCKNMIGSSCDP
jgi:hypothetical protein